MPYSKFICVDKHRVDISECLRGCRLKDTLEAGRCLSVRTLKAIADQREWKGVPSTTQLLKGTREAYLLITQDYAIDPQNSLFMIHGTRGHEKLERYTPDDASSEIRIFDDISSGAYDLYEPEDGGTLTDNKFYGSYATAKTIGLQKVKVQDGVYKTSKAGSYKAGDPKYKWIVKEGGRKSRLDLAIQLNDYRMKLEREGKEVSRMICEILVRDGGTYIAKSRGIMQNAYLVIVNKISDRWVRRYMKKKADDLHKALETGKMPRICSPRERWYDPKTGKSMKCCGYCSVWEFCDYGRLQVEQFNPSKETQEED